MKTERGHGERHGNDINDAIKNIQPTGPARSWSASASTATTTAKAIRLRVRSGTRNTDFTREV
jgi:hypothetical protein